ncbi:hypothetical protein GIB67_035772 [Kingdonia uniflora]|uniref:Uncharacterized protein n=1 Tax=Kingdonia uniflora TaxID=39325 RepID=A0A7J7MJD0_9MAGN|nr:hypothetical protein GIB67_035772 [Kingdonia uniflora]
MVSTSGCAKADEIDLVGHLSPVIGVGDEEDTVAELVEWPHLKGSRVEYPAGSSRFREFCKAKSSIDGIWGHAFRYRGNFFRTCSISQGGDYLYLLPDLAKEKKYRRLGDEVSLEWAASGSERRITAKDFLEYYAVKYVTATDGAYLSSSSSRPYFFDLPSAGQVWNDNLLWVSSECLQRSDEEPLELNNRTITKGISCKVSRKESFIDTVAKEGTELEAVLKKLEISRFKRVASKEDKVRRSLVKMRMVGKTPGSMEEILLTPKLNTTLKLVRLNEMPDRPVDMATVSNTIVRNLAKRKAVVLEESDKITEGADLRPRFEVEAGLLEEQCQAKAREKMVVVVDDEFKKFACALRGVQPGLQDRKGASALKLKEVRAKSVAEAERLVTASATSQNNLARETLPAEKELDVAREREEQTLLYNAEYADEYEALISQYEDRLDDNVKLSLKLKEAKRQVEDKTAIILSRDLALNNLTQRTCRVEGKGCVRELDLDTARTNLAVSEADFENLGTSIVGKDLELRNSAQIRDSLIAREAQSRADLAEVQAKNKSLVDELAHAHENVRRAVQRDKEMNERINQPCARIFELERELRVREMKYQKDPKFELDKRDGEIASGEGSREMKEFLRRKEELVENMRIDLTNYRQKSIDLTRQMSERIDQLTAELAELKARHLKDNKRAAATHQSFKELVVHE